ncbi:MAG: hypothetical protein AAB483_00285 [Patescibacteria group bacterium]
MKNTTIAIIVIVVAVGISGLIFLAGRQSSPAVEGQNVSIVGGKQVVTIDARGGYFPRNSVAQANLPTVIKMRTKGAFDCSNALTIPVIKYRANLPMTGETLIDVPPQAAGTTLNGFCAMGMYSFNIVFH